MPRRLAHVAAFSAAVVLSGALPTGAYAAPRLRLEPPVIGLRHATTVVLTGVRGGVPKVELADTTDLPGMRPEWLPMWKAGASWRATLAAPPFLGVYPVRIRIGRTIIGSPVWLLRVFRRDTCMRRSFASPTEVPVWWIRRVAHATPVAVRPWRLSTHDRRDPRLHRKFVVAYNPAGHRAVGDRLGTFITAVRDGYGGRWCLLQESVYP